MTNKDNGQRDTRAIIILSVIVTLLIGVLIASICMQGFTELDPFGLFADKQEDPSLSGGELPGGGGDLPGGGGDIVIDPEDPNANMIKLSVTPTAVTATDGSTKRRLTATVSPTNAESRLVDWSISWKIPELGNLKDGQVTNYVTVTPTSDGSLTALVECLQAFDEQILIICTSRSNPEAKATCTVDYKEKVEYHLVPYDGESVNTQSFNIVRVTNSKYTKKVSLNNSSIKLRFEFTKEFWGGCHAVMLMGKFGDLDKYVGSKSWTITPTSATSDLIEIRGNYTRQLVRGGFYNFNLAEYIPYIAGDKSSGYYLLYNNKYTYNSNLSQSQINWNMQHSVYPFFSAWDMYGYIDYDPGIGLMFEWIREHALKDAISQGITIGNFILEISENGGQQYEFKFPVSDCKAHKTEMQEIADSYVVPDIYS